jgi:hypothetical protein
MITNKTFKHRLIPNLTCTITAETSKGFKVNTTLCFPNSRKKDKVIIQYFHRIDFDENKGIWEQV